MKAKLLLNLNNAENRKELTRCLNSANYLMALDDIKNEIFRPARKHGYPDRRIQDLLEGNTEDKDAYKRAVEELNSFIMGIQQIGTEEQNDYINTLQFKLLQAEYEKDTSFSQGIDLLEDKFYDILKDRKVDFDDL